MSKPKRKILLGLFIAVAAILAVGAWDEHPGQDPDNQGGVAFAMLGLLVVFCVLIVKATRSVTTLFARSKAAGAEERAHEIEAIARRLDEIE